MSTRISRLSAQSKNSAPGLRFHRLRRALTPEALAVRLSALTVLGLWTLIALVPLLILAGVALRSRLDLIRAPVALPTYPLWSNFREAWDSANLGQAFVNSCIVTGCSLAGLVVLGSLAAYPLARRTGRWANAVFYYFVAGIIVPFQLIIIPLYVEIKTFGLLDTFAGVILVSIAGSLPVVIFLFTGFIRAIPRELEEAAVIDGAGQWRVFWQILFPLMRPITSTVIITSLLVVWNDFFLPLLFLQSEDKRTLPLAIYSFVGQYNNDWPLIFASVIMASLPLILIFLFLQRYFIRGLTSGAVRG
jgi:raffinose/stachyose/melibiose transport system permease protein